MDGLSCIPYWILYLCMCVVYAVFGWCSLYASAVRFLLVCRHLVICVFWLMRVQCSGRLTENCLRILRMCTEGRKIQKYWFRDFQCLIPKYKPPPIKWIKIVWNLFELNWLIWRTFLNYYSVKKNDQKPVCISIQLYSYTPCTQHRIYASYIHWLVKKIAARI